MNEYPTKYSHCSHEVLAKEDLTNKAVILFMSSDDMISQKYRKQLYELIEHAHTAKELLIIYASDIPIEFFEVCSDSQWYRYDLPNEDHFKQIDRFLKQNKDEEILASCSAGVSRSGFVHWYLDVMNEKIDDMYYYESNTEKTYRNYISNFERNGYTANNMLSSFAIKNMDEKHKLLLNKVKSENDREVVWRKTKGKQ